MTTFFDHNHDFHYSYIDMCRLHRNKANKDKYTENVPELTQTFVEVMSSRAIRQVRFNNNVNGMSR